MGKNYSNYFLTYEICLRMTSMFFPIWKTVWKVVDWAIEAVEASLLEQDKIIFWKDLEALQIIPDKEESMLSNKIFYLKNFFASVVG